MKTILWLVATVVVVFGGIWLWKQYHGGSQLGSGDVYVHDSASTSHDTESSGPTNIDGRTETPVTPTPSRSDAPGTINGERIGGATANQPGSGQYPSAQAAPERTYNVAGSAAAPPVTDTISPNPPNGEVFTGTGKYQWYRQGNLTWRVNSTTGVSCVAFATMEEWQKPIVYSHGCGNG